MEVAPSVEVMPSMAVMPRLEGRSRDCAAQAYPLCPAFNVVLPLLLVLLLVIVILPPPSSVSSPIRRLSVPWGRIRGLVYKYPW
ncbi:hypothetical protein PTTW11_03012 [Pyrenophora teres f. teres]|uniref:Uncharacterized protein n=1 Tax=Pyrenophora teres f. teres TaxID=97479 RepID=A0A6S6VSR6_9PLEO|nr:hypothetical protein PTTW11_03012 [Pyrenophora teres f. teres]